MSEVVNTSFVDRLNRALTAWKQLRPTKQFSGMTAEQFELEVHKAAQTRLDLAEAEKMYYHAKAQRDHSNKHMADMLQRIIYSIKGDPVDGPDSELYKACGYLTRSERSKLLRRRSIAPTTTPTATTPTEEPTHPRLAA